MSRQTTTPTSSGAGRLRKFVADRRGGTAMVFAISFVPAVMMIGLAVDFTRASSYSASLKAATDAAALAGATITSDPRNPTSTNLHSLRLAAARSAFNANILSDQEITGLKFNLQEVTNGVRVTTSGTVPNYFAKVLHRQNTSLGATAEAALAANTNYEVAFVLDNTGSMAQSNKMGVLKQAMFKFLRKLQSSSSAKANVHAGLVPFDRMVRVDPMFARGKPWIRQPSRDLGQWQGCIADRQQNHDTDAALPTPADTSTLFDAVDGNLNLFPITPASVSPVPPLPFTPANCGLAMIQPLTNNWNSMNSAINNMQPNGTTNLTIGLAWGLQILTPGEPFNSATPFGGGYTKVMVFLTDGLNTQNRWTTNSNDIDARTRLACNSVKSKGVILYTIGVMDEDRALLESCASTPSKHYFAPDSTQIPDLFDMIANDLITVRLVH